MFTGMEWMPFIREFAYRVYGFRPNERRKRILAHSRLFASPFSTGSSIKPTKFPNDAQRERERERETSSVRPRIYISIPRDNARLLATYTRRISNDSFVSFQFIRDNLAHQFSKTCTAETWQTGEFIGPLPVVIYLRFVCPPAGKEISRSKYSVHAGGEDGEED